MTKLIRTPALQSAVLMIWLLGLGSATGCAGTPHEPQPPRITTEDLHSAPTHLESDVFQGITLPVADQGPHRDDGTVADSYDRSPVGAALAAIQATVRMSVGADDQFAEIGQRMLAPGPGRDAWAVARTQISITGPISTPPVLLGYRVHTYAADHADVAIYTRQPDTSLTANTATVIWLNDDWKLLLPNGFHADPVTVLSRTPADMTALAL